MRFTSSHLLLSFCFLLGGGIAVPAQADVFLNAKLVSVPGVRLQDVQAQIGEDGKGGLTLNLHAILACAGCSMAPCNWRGRLAAP
ncbi:hypothetical protein [Dyella silvatica]|uniref:hypothetical protein n=1 Tax=Dyella silvatica TaxID=2992128 RepID=UPI002B1CCDAF|nr:hypothetical protein [Dyella silvatica]